MNYLKSLKNFLSGKKTYLIGILLIIAGVLAKSEELVLEGIGFITLRAGIEKINK